MDPAVLLEALNAAGLVDQAEAQQILLTLDPDAARVWAEDVLLEAYQKGLSGQQRRLLDLLLADPTQEEMDAFWAQETELFWQDVGPEILNVAAGQAVIGAALGGQDPASFDKVAEDAIAWAEGYYLSNKRKDKGSLPQLHKRTRKSFTKKFVAWQRGELPSQGPDGKGGRGLADLVAEMAKTFSRERAEAISITETTRIFAQAQRVAERLNPDTAGFRLHTAHDERVCEICGPLDGQTRPRDRETWIHPVLGELEGPPFHPRCRCDESPESEQTLQQPTIEEIGPEHFGGARVPEPAAIPTPSPTPPEPETAQAHQESVDEAFPVAERLDDLKVLRPLGGSTGAELVEDPATGRRFVRKRGKNADHLREEAYADQAYRSLGTNVPEMRLYETEEGPVKLAEFIEGRTLGELRQNDKPAYRKAVKAAQKDFSADVLLGNWDVAGLEFDNLLVDGEGKVWRIDNGGALRFRAQGKPKADWDRWATELWSLRDAKINEQTAEIFGDMDFYKLGRQLRGLGKRREELLAVVPEELHEVLGGRLDTLVDVGKIAHTFQKDDWIVGYTDGFARHSVGMRKAGVVEKFPQLMEQAGSHTESVALADERGKIWDDLRSHGGDRSVIAELADYMAQNDADYGAVSYYLSQQAGDSWHGGAQAWKYFFVSQRDADINDAYWWKYGLQEAKKHYLKSQQVIGAEKFDRTLTIYHAFNHEFMRNVSLPNSNRRRGVIELIRTENREVMRMHDMKVGDRKAMKRGPIESTSLTRAVRVFGTEVTVQEVPWQRVFANYLFERAPGSNSCALMGDGENEFVCMLEGIVAEYANNR